MSLESPEYGGDGHLFVGDSTKIISNTAPIHFMDELDASTFKILIILNISSHTCIFYIISGVWRYLIFGNNSRSTISY